MHRLKNARFGAQSPKVILDHATTVEVLVMVIVMVVVIVMVMVMVSVIVMVAVSALTESVLSLHP